MRNSFFQMQTKSGILIIFTLSCVVLITNFYFELDIGNESISLLKSLQIISVSDVNIREALVAADSSTSTSVNKATFKTPTVSLTSTVINSAVNTNNTGYSQVKKPSNLILSNSLKTKKIIFDQGRLESYGYCNGVYSLLSAFTIAILSERQYLIYWPDVENYIQEPFPNTFINKSTLHELRRNGTHWYRPCCYGWEKYKNMKLIITRKLEQEEKQIINYSDIVAFFFEICSNPIYYDRLLSMGLVQAETVQKARLTIAKINETQNEHVVDSVYPIGNYISFV